MTTAILESEGITSMDPQEAQGEQFEIHDEQIAQTMDIHSLSDQLERAKSIAINERKRAQKVAEFMHQHIKAGAKERVSLELRIAAHQQEIANGLSQISVLKETGSALNVELKQARIALARVKAGQEAVLDDAVKAAA